MTRAPRTVLVVFAVNLFAGMFEGFKLAEVADKPRGKRDSRTTSWRLKLMSSMSESVTRAVMVMYLFAVMLRGISVCTTQEKQSGVMAHLPSVCCSLKNGT